jgi:hypothetical protein
LFFNHGRHVTDSAEEERTRDPKLCVRDCVGQAFLPVLSLRVRKRTRFGSTELTEVRRANSNDSEGRECPSLGIREQTRMSAPPIPGVATTERYTRDRQNLTELLESRLNWGIVYGPAQA